MLAAYWKGTAAMSEVFVVVLFASLAWYLARVVEARPVVNVAVTVLGFAWVGVLGSFSALLLRAHLGGHLFLGALVPTVVADMGAWFVGSRMGRHPMAPTISPSKTWEGFLGGAVAALVAGAVIGNRLAPWGGVRHGLELGLVVALVAPLGDLVQSMVKRDLRLKDSGALLPHVIGRAIPHKGASCCTRSIVLRRLPLRPASNIAPSSSASNAPGGCRASGSRKKSGNWPWRMRVCSSGRALPVLSGMDLVTALRSMRAVASARSE